MPTEMTAPWLDHVALAAADPQRLDALSRELLDLQIMRETGYWLAGREVQLSGHPADRDHELVFSTSPRVRHVAFRVDTRVQFSSCYHCVREQGDSIRTRTTPARATAASWAAGRARLSEGGLN
jgi:hypothetical protein